MPLSPYGNPYANNMTGASQPQAPATTQAPNRYIPPTFNWASRNGSPMPNYNQMQWNTMQSSYLPSTSNQGATANSYMQQLQSMLGGFGQQYGSPNRQPQMPNFSSYNPGFGGATSYYDQQRPLRGGSYEDYVSGYSPTASQPGEVRDRSMQPGRDMPYSREDWMRQQQGYGTGQGGYDQQMPGRYSQMGMMPQFNPYMMMANSMRGMDFNQMFDPRFASLFGGNSFGSRMPNSQQIKPDTQMIDDQLASGGKPGNPKVGI